MSLAAKGRRVRLLSSIGVLLIADVLLLQVLRNVEAYPSQRAAMPLAPIILLSMVVSSLILYSGGLSCTPNGEKAGIQRAMRVQGKRWSREGFVRLVAGFTFFVAAFAWMLLVYRVDGIYTTPDTFTYAAVAQAGPFSADFWAGARPFTLPLAFKVFGLTRDALGGPDFLLRARAFTRFQALFSLLSFTALGLVAAWHVERRVLKSAMLTLIVALGLTLDVSQWNKMLLSESLTMSLMSLMVAAWLVAFRTLGRWEELSLWRRMALLLLFAVIITLFSFTRDTNAYLLLILGATVLIAFAVKRVRAHPGAGALLAAAAIMIAVSMLQDASLRKGDRWLIPFLNVFRTRILEDERATRYFEEHGAPIQEVYQSLLDIECEEDNCRELYQFLERDGGGWRLLTWIKSRGRYVYVRYLIADPVALVLAPLEDIDHMVSPDSSEYRRREHPDPAWFGALRGILYPKKVGLVLTWAAVLLAVLSFALWRQPQSVDYLVPVVLLATAFPLMIVVWHGDAVELERHAAQIAFQLRLALWMGSGFALGYLQREVGPFLRRAGGPHSVD